MKEMAGPAEIEMENSTHCTGAVVSSVAECLVRSKYGPLDLDNEVRESRQVLVTGITQSGQMSRYSKDENGVEWY